MKNLWWLAVGAGAIAAGAIAKYSFNKKQQTPKPISTPPINTYVTARKTTKVIIAELFAAIANNDITLVRELLANNKITIATVQDENGDTLVMKALKSRKNDIILCLVEQICKEGNIHTLKEISNNQKETALDIAHDYCSVTEELLEKIIFSNDNDNSENAAGALSYYESLFTFYKEVDWEEINNHQFATNSQTVSAGNLKFVG